MDEAKRIEELMHELHKMLLNAKEWHLDLRVDYDRNYDGYWHPVPRPERVITIRVQP